MDQTLEQTTMRKVYLRMLPLAMIVYFFCYLDRINISFAALQMNASIGLYGCGVWPELDRFLSRLLHLRGSEQRHPGKGRRAHLDRAHHDHLGHRIWRHCVRHRTNSFLTVRFLLGVAEAGLFPGIVLLFTYWFPDHHRARIVSSFTLALPISVAIGAPISTSILGLDGFLGYAGWKWIYIMEAIPTVLIGIFVLFAHDRQPAKARWLRRRRRTGWSARWSGNGARWKSGGKYSIWQAW